VSAKEESPHAAAPFAAQGKSDAEYQVRSLRPKAGTRPRQLILEFYDDAQLAEIYDRLMR
jgi:hypothetical protein